MIKVTLPDRTLALIFTHQRKIIPIVKGFRMDGPTHFFEKLTKCEVLQLLEKPNTSLILATGIAKCDKRDNFCKDTGRKLALTHALWQQNGAGKRVSQFSKFEREAIWEAYHDRGIGGLIVELRFDSHTKTEELQG